MVQRVLKNKKNHEPLRPSVMQNFIMFLRLDSVSEKPGKLGADLTSMNRVHYPFSHLPEENLSEELHKRVTRQGDFR